MSLPISLVALPITAVALARLLRLIFFPPAPTCSSESPEMMQHCQDMSQRFFGIATATTAAAWVLAPIVIPFVGSQSLLERLTFALSATIAS